LHDSKALLEGLYQKNDDSQSYKLFLNWSIHSDDDTNSAKDGDFTSETINKLIKGGYESTWRKYPQSIL
jgi:hypothetical protein